MNAFLVRPDAAITIVNGPGDEAWARIRLRGDGSEITLCFDDDASLERVAAALEELRVKRLMSRLAAHPTCGRCQQDLAPGVISGDEVRFHTHPIAARPDEQPRSNHDEPPSTGEAVPALHVVRT